MIRWKNIFKGEIFDENFLMSIATEQSAVAMAVLTMNFRPNTLKAIRKNGTFKRNIVRPTGVPKRELRIVEIPVNPPRDSLLGIENILIAAA